MAMTHRCANSRVVVGSRIAGALAMAALTTAMAAPVHAQTLQATNTVFPVTRVLDISSLTVHLTANATIELQGLQIATDYTEFTIFRNDCLNGAASRLLPAGTICDVTIRFSPRSPGWASAPAPISRSAPLIATFFDPAVGRPQSVSFPLTGTGTQSTGILSPGLISDLIGNDITRASGFGGDGGPANGAQFNTPGAIAMDLLGNIYIADTGNAVVRLIYQAGSFPEIDGVLVPGNIYTVAGAAPAGSVIHSGPGIDGVFATQSPLNGPAGLSIDGAGNLYIADSNNQAIRMVNALTGVITTVAGILNSSALPVNRFAGDLGAATHAQLYNPAQISVDGFGNLFIADTANHAIRVVYAGGQTLASLITLEVPGSTAIAGNIYTISGGPGNFAPSGTGDGGPASAANLNSPVGVTVDSAGNIYIADSANNAARRVDAITGAISTIFQGGDSPTSVAVDATDNIYFTLRQSCTVSVYNPGVQANGYLPSITTIAGNGTCTPSGDGGASTLAGFSGVTGLVIEGYGNLYALEADGVRLINRLTTSLDFGSVDVGATSYPVSVLLSGNDIRQRGNFSPMDFSGFQIDSPDGSFSQVPYVGNNPNISDCNALSIPALTPGSVCGASFVFQPTTDGGPFTSSATTDIGLSIAFSGVGTGPLPTAAITGGPLSFSSIVNETTSPAQVLTLTNTSNIRLFLSQIFFSSPNFHETDTCGISILLAHPALAPGASCQISVTFLARAPGTLNGSIFVIDNAGTQTAQLAGIGYAPLGVFSPVQLTYTSVSPGATAILDATLTNAGTAPLNIDPASWAINGNNPGSFHIVSNSCGATLAVGAACHIATSFTRQTYGFYSADLTVQDDSGGVPSYFITSTNSVYAYVTQTLHLASSATSPTQNASFILGNAVFPLTAVGQNKIQTVTLTLNTAAALTSIALAPGFSEYSLGVIAGCALDGITINPAGTICSIPITFTPIAPGIRNAPLTVTTVESGANVPYAFGLTGTGSGSLVALTPGIITTVAGSAHGRPTGIVGADGPATLAETGFQSGMALDASGQIFLADSENNVIWKVDAAGNIHLYAGTPFISGGYIENMSGDGGPALGASLGYIGPIALDAKGGLYLGDTDGYGEPPRLRYIDPATSLITTVAGGTPFDSAGCNDQTDAWGDGCTGLQAAVGTVAGVATDAAGNVYFSDNGAALIRRYDAATKIVTAIAGAGTKGSSGDGGPATTAHISPHDLAFDSTGNLYFIDGDDGSLLRKIDHSTGIISTIAGHPGSIAQATLCGGDSGAGGTANAAQFAHLTSLAIDPADNIYLVDQYACRVSRIDAATGTIQNIAGLPGVYDFYNGGSGDLGVLNADGDATQATLAQPGLIRLDSFANIYLAGSFGGVRKVDVSQSVLNFTGSNRVDTASIMQSPNTVSAPQTVTVVNAGNSSFINFSTPFLSPPAWGLSSSDFIRDVTSPLGIPDCYATASLTSGAECPISIDFAPLTSAGWVTALDNINDTALTGAGSQPIHLIGYSSGTSPLVTLTPALLSFSTPEGGLSAPQILTLTNQDVNPLPIASIAISGSGATSFIQTNNCGSLLPANSTCNISVSFKPGIVPPGTPPPDVLTATVTVIDDAGNSPQFSQLNGTGSLPAVGSVASIGEDIIVTDTVVLVAATPLVVSEMVIVSDTTVNTPATPLLIDENVIVSDAITLVPPTTLLISENVIVSDDISVTPATPLVIGENVTVSDAISLTPATPLVINEDVAVSDSLALTQPTVLNLNENLSLSDSPALTISIALNLDETISLSDSAVLTPSIALNLIENISLSDAAVLTPSITLNLNEMLSLSDSVTLTPAIALNLTENISLSDAAVVTPSITLNLNEVLSLSDKTILIPPTVLNINEVLSLSESPDFTPAVVLNLSEVLSLSDAAVLAPTTVLNLHETVSLSDVTVLPAAPVIVFSVADHTFGDTPFTVVASSNSTGAITYSRVSGPAAISGSTVTLTGAGPVILVATQAAVPGAFIAASQQTPFNVAKGSATVTLGSLSATYDGNAHTASATTTPAGLAVNFTYNGSTIAPTAAGSYAVVAIVNDVNYQGSQTATLVIAAPTVGGTGTPLLTTTTIVTKVATGYQVVVTEKNTGTGAANNVVLTSALLGAASGLPLPASFGNIASGASASATLTFPVSAGVSGAMVLEKLTGTYTGGTFGSSFRVTLP